MDKRRYPARAYHFQCGAFRQPQPDFKLAYGAGTLGPGNEQRI
jgi:hypothetical protein